MLVENLLNYLFQYVKKHKQNHSLLLFSSLMMFGKILGNPFYYTLLASWLERVSTAMRASTRRLVRNLGDPLACEMRVVGVAAAPALLLVRNCTKTASGLLANNCCSSSSKTREMY